MATATRNLPAPSSPFIGRTKELAELTHLLADPACKLLALVGPGGSGKTRLAIQVAAQQSDYFPQGTYVVPLAPLSLPDHIPSAAASVLGFSFDGSDTPRRQLINYLAKLRLLLVVCQGSFYLWAWPERRLFSKVRQLGHWKYDA